MIYVGIVAGGTGSRMGADRPKQFLEIGGRPIILRTLDIFLKIQQADLIYVAVHHDWLEYTSALAEREYQPEEISKLRFIEGGSDRNGSVLKIIDAIASDNTIVEDDILLTHDAVRPFVTEDIILRNIDCVKSGYPCTTAIPSTDTILCCTDGNSITDTPDRSTLWQAQTPQSFRIMSFLDAFSRLNESDRSELTDVCGVFTKSGSKVKIVKGDPCNIKLTTPFDLKIAVSLI